MCGLTRVLNHLSAYFALSEAESKRILTEVSHAILIGCCLETEVVLPKLGRFFIGKNGLELEGSVYSADFAKTFDNVSYARDLTIKSTVGPLPPQQQDKTRESLYAYLKSNYSSALDWQHPKGQTYTHAIIKDALAKVRQINDDYYLIFYSRLVSGQKRSSIASAFLYSEASVKRRCDTVLASILLLVVYPELSVDGLTKLYRY